MEYEVEITVKPIVNLEEISRILLGKNFKVVDKYCMHDVYMLPEGINIYDYANLDILKKCILVRNINNEHKQLLYKYKEFAEDGSILKQGKAKCPIYDIEAAIAFMKAIAYRKLFVINNDSIIFGNGEIEVAVQNVEGLGIYIEIEANDKYKTESQIIDYILKLDIPIKKGVFFAKKAEDALIKLKNNNGVKDL